MDECKFVDSIVLSLVEKYGIVEYKVTYRKSRKYTDKRIIGQLTYYKSYREYLGTPRYTMKHTVEIFDNGGYIEKTQKMSKYMSVGEYNVM